MINLARKIVVEARALGYAGLQKFKQSDADTLSHLVKDKLNYAKSMESYDDTRDIAVSIVSMMVQLEFVKDCTDTNDVEEFDYQDTIQEAINEELGIEEEE